MPNTFHFFKDFFGEISGKAALIFCVAFLLFSNTIGHNYAWDDYAVIVNNQHTQKGWKALPEIFTQKVYLPERQIYRPVVQSSFALEVAVFGNNPHVAHFFNVLIYACVCVALFFLLHLLFGAKFPWLSFYTVLLYTVMPVHSESVANIKSRDELLMLFFGLCMLIFFVKAVSTFHWRYIAGALFAFTLSFLCKENGILLLFIAPVIAIYIQPKPMVWVSFQWKTNRLVFTAVSILILAILALSLSLQFKVLALFNILLLLTGYLIWSVKKAKTTFKKLLPLTVVLFLAVVLYSMLVQTNSDNQEKKELLKEEQVTTLPPPPPQPNRLVEPLNNVLVGATGNSQKVSTIALIMGKYVQLMVLPVTLVYHYGYNQLPLTDFTDFRVWVSILLHLSLLFYAFAGLRKRKILSFAILFYFISISVYTHITIFLPETLQIPLFGNYILKIYAQLYNILPDTLAERFLLMPSIGFCIALVYALGFVTQKYFNPEESNRVNNYAFWLIFGGLMLFYGVKTFSRNTVWKDNETLFTSDIQNMPDNAMAHVYYGKVWLNKLHSARNKEQAFSFFKKFEAAQLRAIEIYPKFLSARLDLAAAYQDLGVPDKAQSVLEETIDLLKDEPAAHFGFGHFFYRQEKYKEAIPYFENALTLEEYYPEAYRYLAWCYFHTKDDYKAHSILIKGAELYQDKSHFYTLSAHFYSLQSDYKRAITAAEKAIAINPNDKTALLTLAKSYEQMGDSSQMKFYQERAEAIKN